MNAHTQVNTREVRLVCFQHFSVNTIQVLEFYSNKDGLENTGMTRDFIGTMGKMFALLTNKKSWDGLRSGSKEEKVWCKILVYKAVIVFNIIIVIK